jgi:superfamily II DNA or RNA helicase
MRVRIDGYVWLSASELDQLQASWLKNQLSVPRVGNERSLVHCYDEREGQLGIAREFFFGKLTKEHAITINVSQGDPWRDGIPTEGPKVVDENRQALEMVKESLNVRLPAGGILCAPAGWGKINTAIELISDWHRKALVLVDTTHRAALWRSRLAERRPNIKVGRLANRKWEMDSDTHVVVASVDSVAAMVKKGNIPEGIEKAFGLVICDQVSQMDPDYFSKAIGYFHAAKRLGLMSKVAREDKADKVFEYHLGGRIFTSKVAHLTPRVRRVYTSFRISHPYFNPQMASRDMVVEVISKNLNYNEAVTDQITEALQAKRKIVVFSDSFEHLKRLKTEVESKFKDQPIKTDYITEGMLDSDIEAASVADVIFASYKVSSRRFDIPAIDTVVLASPIKNPEFPVQWSLSPLPGKKTPVVVDVRCDQIPLCKEYGEERDRAYTRFFPAPAAVVNG